MQTRLRLLVPVLALAVSAACTDVVRGDNASFDDAAALDASFDDAVELDAGFFDGGDATERIAAHGCEVTMIAGSTRCPSEGVCAIRTEARASCADGRLSDLAAAGTHAYAMFHHDLIEDRFFTLDLASPRIELAPESLSPVSVTAGPTGEPRLVIATSSPSFEVAQLVREVPTDPWQQEVIAREGIFYGRAPILIADASATRIVYSVGRNAAGEAIRQGARSAAGMWSVTPLPRSLDIPFAMTVDTMGTPLFVHWTDGTPPELSLRLRVETVPPFILDWQPPVAPLGGYDRGALGVAIADRAIAGAAPNVLWAVKLTDGVHLLSGRVGARSIADHLISESADLRPAVPCTTCTGTTGARTATCAYAARGSPSDAFGVASTANGKLWAAWVEEEKEGVAQTQVMCFQACMCVTSLVSSRSTSRLFLARFDLAIGPGRPEVNLEIPIDEPAIGLFLSARDRTLYAGVPSLGGAVIFEIDTALLP